MADILQVFRARNGFGRLSLAAGIMLVMVQVGAAQAPRTVGPSDDLQATTGAEAISLLDFPVSMLPGEEVTPADAADAELLAVPVRKFQPGQKDVAFEDRTLRFKGIDLTEAPWFVSSELEPGAGPEQIAVDASPTTPIALLKAPRIFDRATLFTVLLLESAPELPARLTIGHIEGTDEVFINGTLIGRTDLHELTPLGAPRSYTISPGLLRKGPNILAVRMQGTNGRQTFGIIRGPLTFQFLPKDALRDLVWPDRPSTVTAAADLDTSQVLDLLIAGKLLSEEERGKVRRRPAGWGRFGFSAHDGLPAVEFVSPVKMRNRTAPSLEVVHDEVTGLTLEPVNRPVTAFRKGFQVEVRAADQSVRYMASWSVLYPGMRIVGTGTQALPLRILFPGGTGELTPLHGLLAESGDDGLESGVQVYAAWQPRSRSCPLLIAIQGGAANVTGFDHYVDLAIRPKGEASLQIHAWYPTGIGTVDLRGLREPQPTAFLERIASQTGQTSAALLARWLRVGGYFPVASDEWFISQPGVVRIWTVGRYRSLFSEGGKSGIGERGRPLVPRPPLIDRLISERLLPEVEGRSATGVYTWSGAQYFVEPTVGEYKGGDVIAVTGYELPVPALSRRLLPRSEELGGARRKLLNELVEDFGTSVGATALDMLGSGLEAALRVWTQLDTVERRRLFTDSGQALAMSLRSGPPWSQTTEPLTGLPFLLSGAEVGPGEELSGLDAPLSSYLALVGLMAGEIPINQLLTDRIGQIRSIAAYLWCSDDWEWMKSARSARGVSAGGTEGSFAHAAAMQALIEVGRTAGDGELVDLARYGLARSMVGLQARTMLTSWPSFGNQDSSGTTESLLMNLVEGAAAVTMDPSSTSNGALEHAAGIYRWPELAEALMFRSPGGAFRSVSRLSKSWQRVLASGSDIGSFTPMEMEGLCALMALRARLRQDSAAELEQVERGIAARRGTVTPASHALAAVEVAFRSMPDVYLKSWEGVTIQDFSISQPEGPRNRRTARIVTRLTESIGRLVLQLEAVPQEVTINGGPIPLTDFEHEGTLLQLKIRRKGDSAFEIRF